MVDQKGFNDDASTLRLVGHEDVAGTGEDFQARVGEDRSHAAGVLDRHQAVEVPVDEETSSGPSANRSLPILA